MPALCKKVIRKIFKDNLFGVKMYVRTMDINSPKGTQIKFTANGGYDYEKIAALKILKYNETYTIEEIFVGEWVTKVVLAGFPKKYFNSCLFENIN